MGIIILWLIKECFACSMLDDEANDNFEALHRGCHKGVEPIAY